MAVPVSRIKPVVTFRTAVGLGVDGNTRVEGGAQGEERERERGAGS